MLEAREHRTVGLTEEKVADHPSCGLGDRFDLALEPHQVSLRGVRRAARPTNPRCDSARGEVEPLRFPRERPVAAALLEALANRDDVGFDALEGVAHESAPATWRTDKAP